LDAGVEYRKQTHSTVKDFEENKTDEKRTEHKNGK
jgi:hypothetical protein